nr:uncharacterized protein LOC109148625 [Ipomoea batatas]
MLSKRESSESRSLPPEVQEALECNTKKSKHEGGEAMANANPVEDTPRKIKTPINTVSRGRGGRSRTPRKAAAQKEHTVVKGSTKSKLISKTTVAQQPKELEILSPTTRKPPFPSVPPDDGMDFFNCDTPKDALKNTDKDRNQASLMEDTNMLN